MRINIFSLLIFLMAILNINAKEKDIQKTMRTAILDNLKYENAPIKLVIMDLRARVKKLPGIDKNMNIILALSKGKKAENYRVDIELNNIPLGPALKYITQTAGLGFFIMDRTIVIADKNIARTKMETRTFTVRPSNGIVKKLDENEIKKGKDEMENNIDFFND